MIEEEREEAGENLRLEDVKFVRRVAKTIL
jgi:hypothetical protein